MLRPAAVSTALAVTALAGCSDAPSSTEPMAEQAQTGHEWIACAQTIAVGDVVKIVGADARRVTITMRVTDWIKPDHGPPSLVFTEKNPKIDGVWPAWKTGGPVLIGIPGKRTDGVNSFRGAQLTSAKKLIHDDLEAAATTDCPPPWSG